MTKALELFSEASRAAALKGKPLRLGQAAAIVITISVVVLLYAAVGIHDIAAGRKHHALLYCGLTALMLMTLPIHVLNLVRVKKGVRVPVLNPLPLIEVLRVPLSVKVTLVAFLTLLVSAVSYQSFSSFHLPLHSVSRLLIFTTAFNLFLWVVVAFAWYLFVVLHQREPQTIGSALEQGKEFWPPTPLVPKKSYEE